MGKRKRTVTRERQRRALREPDVVFVVRYEGEPAPTGYQEIIEPGYRVLVPVWEPGCGPEVSGEA